MAQPVLVSEQQRVLACNAAAGACGIVPAMPLATAHALCPSMEVIARCRGREQQALLALAYWCYRFTPAVSLHTPAAAPAADSLLLEIAPSLHLFGGLKKFLLLIKQGLDEQMYIHSAGLAPTPGAAWLLSHAGAAWGDLFADGLFADGLFADGLFANDLFIDGLFANESGQLHDLSAYQRLLDAVPLRHLDCPAKVKEKFVPTGFQRLGELLRLPRSALGKRYGKAFLTYLEQVTGQQPDPRPPIRLPSRFVSALEFSGGIHSAEMLLFPMRRLLMALCGYLQRRQLHCGQLQWQLDQVDGDRATIPLRLSRPQNQLAHFVALSRLRLENLQLDGPVERLTLRVEDLHQARHEAVDLFGDGVEGADASAFAELCDRLRTRLGTDAISGLALADSHIPEQAWQAVANGSPRPALAADVVVPAARPLWLFTTPAPIRVRGRQLHWRGALELLRGPERIDSGWWQNAASPPPSPAPSLAPSLAPSPASADANPLQAPVQRDYFVARHQDGPLYWVYRDRRSRRWFVHGAFG